MFKLKDKAFELRKKYKSYNEISQLLGIPKSTLSGWFKKIKLSSDIKKILIKRSRLRAIYQLRKMSLANKEKWTKIHLSYRRKAQEQFSKLLPSQLFCAGLMIYWGEGDKRLKNGVVRIANIDYRMLKLFTAFLIKICNVRKEKIKFWLLLYPDLEEKKCIKYWSKKLNISQAKSLKSQYIKGKSKSRKIDYGVCYIQICSRELKEKILEWITLFNNYLLNAGMV